MEKKGKERRTKEWEAKQRKTMESKGKERRTKEWEGKQKITMMYCVRY